MKIRPLHDRILVKRIEEETKTSGGLFIPDSAKEKPIQAKVIAVGAGKRDKDGKLIALDVKAGDRVLFSKYSGTEVKIDGEEHLIMREDDLLATSPVTAPPPRPCSPRRSTTRARSSSPRA
jgi:chaperonin GroES